MDIMMKSLNYNKLIKSLFPDNLNKKYKDLGISKNIIENAYWDFCSEF